MITVCVVLLLLGLTPVIAVAINPDLIDCNKLEAKRIAERQHIKWARDLNTVKPPPNPPRPAPVILRVSELLEGHDALP